MTYTHAGKNDECYTPAYAVRPILEYIPEGATVWLPFDTWASEFVTVIGREHDVIPTHIDNGKDFFEFEPDHWDLLVSNPPFTNKRAIFGRALSFGKPFALLMDLAWLRDKAPIDLFYDYGLQLLIPDERIKFLNKGVVKADIPFKAAYFCWNFLDRDIVLHKLDPNNQLDLFKSEGISETVS